jgi:hypothetical protein
MDQAARENRAIYQPYETTDPVFDTTNLDRFTADLPCPKVDAEMLHRFWKFAEADRWGKRRKIRPEVPAWIEDELQSRVASERAARQASHPPLSLGLDIRGPGGGQWHLKLRGAEVSAVRPGLPKRVDSLLTCRVTDWHQFLEEARDEAIWRLEKALQVADGNPADLSNHVYTALFANGKTSRSQGADWLAATG